MDRKFDIEPEEFQERKRRRISTMNAMEPPPAKVAPTSAPGVHEIATFLPGRLEFEHELDNDAEDLVKDIEFGVCLDYEGDQIPEDEDDLDVRARLKWEEERHNPPKPAMLGKGKSLPSGKAPKGLFNGKTNGYHGNGDHIKQETHTKTEDGVNGVGIQDDADVEEVTQPPPFETKESMNFKLTLFEMYSQRVDKRLESKSIMFNRGLLDYKKVCGLIHISLYYSKDPSEYRCKLRRRSVLGRRGRLFIDYAPLPGYRQLKTLRRSRRICSVGV